MIHCPAHSLTHTTGAVGQTSAECRCACANVAHADMGTPPSIPHNLYLLPLAWSRWPTSVAPTLDARRLHCPCGWRTDSRHPILASPTRHLVLTPAISIPEVSACGFAMSALSWRRYCVHPVLLGWESPLLFGLGCTLGTTSFCCLAVRHATVGTMFAPTLLWSHHAHISQREEGPRNSK
jgi:hypothetical protein